MVDIVPFNAVTADYAWLEGEDDQLLEQWRKVHWVIFSRELIARNKKPEQTMPVVCEYFEVVYGAEIA
jgi:uncharacterized protein YhfF